MPHRLLALIESHHLTEYFAMMATIVTASLTAAVTAEQAEVRLLMMPLVGALVGTTGMILLAPSIEDRRRIAGRGIFSITIGSGTPVMFGFITDYGRAMAGHPVALFMFGIMAGMVVFAVSRPLAEGLFARSQRISDAALDAAESSASLPAHPSAKPTTKSNRIQPRPHQ